MSGQSEEICGCDLVQPVAGTEGCSCEPNVALTCEEELILGKMREIKTQVHSIMNRMKELKEAMPEIEVPGSAESQPELVQLLSQLEDLRNRWQEWETKLNEAIEKKLILLGHRQQPSAIA